VLDKHIADVPEDERHWSSWLCVCFLSIVPRITVSIDAASTVAINVDALASDDEASVVILENNGIRVVSPVVEIV
jgi:hypothetical protein